MWLHKFRLLTVISVVPIPLQKDRFYQTLPSSCHDMEEKVGTLLCLCSYFPWFSGAILMLYLVWVTLVLTSHRNLACMKGFDRVLSPSISYTIYYYIDPKAWAIQFLKSMRGEAAAVWISLHSYTLLLANLHKYCRPCWEGAPPSDWFGQFYLKRQWWFTDTKGHIFKHFVGF